MKYADYACAWFIFAIGMIDVVLTEVTHPPGVILDTGLLWIFVAMFNLLRLRNGDSIKGLTIVCITANLAESVLLPLTVSFASVAACGSNPCRQKASFCLNVGSLGV